ncbi:ABC transporter ATP-binding protein [Acidobacteriota bacterium]
MIKTRGLGKTYRDDIVTTALQNINLSVDEGEFVAVMGPTGSGKTTLLNILGLIDSATEGDYKLFRQDVSHLTEIEKAVIRKENIGFVFQSPNLINEMSVYENIEFPLMFLKISSSERKQRVHEALERIQLFTRRRNFPPNLSGGQKQKIAIARALITRPKFIIVDEPTGHMDTSAAGDIMEFLAGLNSEGSTILMATHSDYCAHFSQRIIYIKEGTIPVPK